MPRNADPYRFGMFAHFVRNLIAYGYRYYYRGCKKSPDRKKENKSC